MASKRESRAELKARMHSELVQLADSIGWKILEEYTYAKTRMLMECANGHRQRKSADAFKRGQRCVECLGVTKEQAKNRLLISIGEQNCQLLSEYKGAVNKVKVRCENGHDEWRHVSSINKGHKCKVCRGLDSYSASNKLSESIKESGWVLLDEYKSTHEHILAKCNNGHKVKITPSGFLRGTRCSICAGLNKSVAEDEFISSAKVKGFSVIGNYASTHKPVLVMCANGHFSMKSPSNMKRKIKTTNCKDCEALLNKGHTNPVTLLRDDEFRNSPCFVYVTELVKGSRSIYKIGISSVGHRTRNKMKSDGYHMNYCVPISTTRGKAFITEQICLEKMSNSRFFNHAYKGNGGTEFVNENPLPVALSIFERIQDARDSDIIFILENIGKEICQNIK